MRKSILLLFGALILFSISCGTSHAGLVAYLPMNESSWSGAPPQVIDTTGNGHNGTVVGGANTVADSMFGRVGSFDGNGQLVDLGGSGTISGARSVVAWVNFQANSLFLGQPIIVGGVPGAGDFFGIAGNGGENSGVPQYDLYIDHWATAAYHSDIAVTPNQWNQVAFTYDGAGIVNASTVNFYINGQAAGSWISNGLYNYGIDTYTIAGNTIGGTTTEGSLNGLMHGVGIYDSELTSSQILALYQSVVPEPASATLFRIGVAGIVCYAWRKRRMPAQ